VKPYYASIDHLMLLDQWRSPDRGDDDPPLRKAHSSCAVRAGGGCRRHWVGMASATGRPFLPGAGLRRRWSRF
jgi:hypothetical protein